MAPVVVKNLVLVVLVAVVLGACGGSDRIAADQAETGSSESSAQTGTTLAASTASLTTGVPTQPSIPAVETTVPPDTELDTESGGTESGGTGSGSSSCVTVVTTIPGERYCDGYDPFPERSTPDGSSPCPQWAAEPATRPDGGWLGTEGTSVDDLSRSGLDLLDGSPEWEAFSTRAAGLVPPDFVADGGSAMGVRACLDATLSMRAVFRHADGSRLLVLSDRLLSQYDWERQPPSGTIQRQSLDDRSELATASYSDGLALRAWVASPEGRLTRVVAFGANAPTFSGFPTTIPPQPTSDPPTPVPMTLDQVVELVLAVAAG